MTKIFIDANVIISVLNSEYPAFPFAAKVLSLADNPNYRLFTSPLSIAISFYFATKKCGVTKAHQKIILLGNKIQIVDTPEDCLKQLAKDKKIKDVEDGMQYYAAKRQNVISLLLITLKIFTFRKSK
ncbi:MAG: PIN domain-containing protein [Bacteroidetes bacterium]|nr:PIN domain-containing protein [Bacteroidota bacterium]